MTKTLAALLITLGSALLAHGQIPAVDEQKVDAFAHAIARAEGFGVPHAIPTRYHNPGDIRAHRGVHYPGQVGLNRRGYVIFKDDAAGFAALKDILRKMARGESRHYGRNMTILKVAKIYATGWRTWSKNVAHNLGVPPTTTLSTLFAEDEILPPAITLESTMPDLGTATPVMPTLAPVYAASVEDFLV
jgi:hypothetical protein